MDLWHFYRILLLSSKSERTQIKKEHELKEHSAFQLNKAVVRHGFREIRFHRALDKEQIVVLTPNWGRFTAFVRINILKYMYRGVVLA